MIFYEAIGKTAFVRQIGQSAPVNIDHCIFPSFNGMRWLICSGVDR